MTSLHKAFTEGLEDRRIEALFVGQVYRNDQDDHPMELDPTPFDATTQVLIMCIKDVRALIDEDIDFDSIDELVPHAVKDAHGGPFRVEGLAKAAAVFFSVNRGQNVTESMLEAARVAHRVGKMKTYHVQVQRTVTTSVWIEVDATTQETARGKAMDAAGDYDFNNEGSKSDPEYSIEDIQEVMSQEEAMHVVRPRMT